MAYYTKINKYNLQKHVDQYKIGKLFYFKGIKEGIENTNYFFKTEKGNFVLTIFENKITERIKNKNLTFFIDLIKFLRIKNFPTPSILRGINKKHLINFYNKPSVIVEFITGNNPKNINKNHCYELGKILSVLHKNSLKFKKKKKNNFSLNEWEILIYKKLNLKKNHFLFLKNEIKFLKKNWPKNIPSGIIHGDLFPDNVFFKKNKINGIIDLSNACNDFFCYDLSICINAWCFNKKIDLNKTRNLIKGYSFVRKLQKKEINYFPIFLRASSLRFYLSRLMDSKNKKIPKQYKKNPNEYLKKLKYFQENNLSNFFNKI